ncbi:12382_t:CDS:2, partial [Acaulospora colombiana]
GKRNILNTAKSLEKIAPSTNIDLQISIKILAKRKSSPKAES